LIRGAPPVHGGKNCRAKPTLISKGFCFFLCAV